MNVVIYQTAPTLLDLQANLEDVEEKIHQGREKGADLIIFPELALTGYFVGTRYHEVALRLDSEEIKRLASATQGTAVVVGFVEESLSMNFYNSALVAVDGEILFAYRKLNLPNYGIFEERKYFASGKHIPVFRLHDFNLAVFICNDLWHPSLPYLGVVQKADVFVSLFNSSEASMGREFSNMETWGIINTFYSRVFGIYNLCANRVGEETLEIKQAVLKDIRAQANLEPEADVEGQIIKFNFWGGSEIINPFGMQEAKAALYRPDEIWGEVHRDIRRKKKILLPYLRNDDPYFTYRELGRILFNKGEPDEPEDDKSIP